MTKKLKEAFERAQEWPEEAQEELAAIAFDMDSGLNGEMYHATPEELEGIDRGLKAAREGRFASKQEIEELFAQFDA